MSRPEMPELEALRSALAPWDEWPSTLPDGAGRIIEAAREVLRVYDEQLARYDFALAQAPISAAMAREAMGLPPLGQSCTCDVPGAVFDAHCLDHGLGPR